MKEFSFNRVWWLFRKSYTEYRRHYAALLLWSFGFPLLLAFISRAAVTALTVGSTVALTAILFSLYISFKSINDKGSAIVGLTLPVSLAERYCFILLNTTVVLAVWVVAVYSLSAFIAMKLLPFGGDGYIDTEMMMTLIYKNKYLYIGFLGTHAGMLLINVIRRKSVVMPYVVAMVAVAVAQLVIVEFSPADMVQDVKMWCNIALAAVVWPLGYYLLRKREIKI
ncbi:MAG: hypothetical protein J6Q33_07125 [Alistipes sp.]|nr:hypothetical protein [Alistipes sp.]